MVTANTGINFIGFILLRFAHKVRVGQERTRHRYHVSITPRQHFFSYLRGVNAVRCDHWNRKCFAEFSRYPRKCRTGYFSCYGWDTRLVPTNTSVNDSGTRFFDFFTKLNDFFISRATFNKVKHRQTIDNDKVLTYCLAHAAYYFNRQTDSVFIFAAPLIVAVVSTFSNKLIKEIALRPHYLNTIVTCALGLGCGGNEILNLLFNLVSF